MQVTLDMTPYAEKYTYTNSETSTRWTLPTLIRKSQSFGKGGGASGCGAKIKFSGGVV